MNQETENKLIQIANKYMPMLDNEIELAEKQLDYTRQKHFDREKNKSFVQRMERE